MRKIIGVALMLCWVFGLTASATDLSEADKSAFYDTVRRYDEIWFGRQANKVKWILDSTYAPVLAMIGGRAEAGKSLRAWMERGNVADSGGKDRPPSLRHVVYGSASSVFSDKKRDFAVLPRTIRYGDGIWEMAVTTFTLLIRDRASGQRSYIDGFMLQELGGIRVYGGEITRDRIRQLFPNLPADIAFPKEGFGRRF